MMITLKVNLTMQEGRKKSISGATRRLQRDWGILIFSQAPTRIPRGLEIA